MKTDIVSLWRNKVSRGGFKWSCSIVLSAALIVSGFFIFIPALAEHTATVTVEPLYVQGNHIDTYTFEIINNGPDAIYKIVITADTGFTINNDPTCPSGWLASHAASTAECLTDGNPANPDLLTNGNSKIVSFSATSPSPTSDSIYTWAVATNDNTWGSYNANAQTLVDVTDPITTIFGDAPVGWQTEKPVSITLTCDDGEDGSGCENIYYSTNGTEPTNIYSGPISISAEGDTTIKYLSKDNAGNQESLNEVTIQIDTIAPETVDDADSEWHNSDITVTLTPTDATSGVAATYYTTEGTTPTVESDQYSSPFTLGEEGEHPLKYFSTDVAGNEELVVVGSTVKIDKTKPSTTATVDPAAPDGLDNWYVTKPSITLECEDQEDLSGCDKIYYRWGDSGDYSIYNSSIDAPEGDNTLYYYSEDVAGNEEVAQTLSLKVDTVEPEITTYNVTNAVFSPNDDTVKDTATVDLEFSEAVETDVNILNASQEKVKDLYESSGVTNPDPKTWDGKDNDGVLVSDGVYTIEITLIDPAGNQLIDISKTLTVDTIAPSVEITSPLTDDNVTGDVVITFSDNELITPQCSIDETNWVVCQSGTTKLSDLTGFTILSDGNFSLYLKDIDIAGNTGTDNETGIIKDTTAPTIDSFTAPGADAVYKAGQGGVPLVFTASDTNSISCSYSVNGADSVGVSCSNGVEFTGTIPDDELSDGREEVVIIITDAAENSVESSPISFVFDDDNILRVGVTGTDFSSIQAAIDKATTGDKIEISAGTYIEDLVINKDNLELYPSAGATVTVKGIDTEPDSNWPLANPNIDLQANRVKIHGLTIESPTAADGYYSSGLVLNGTDTEIYDNNFISKANGNGYCVVIQTYRDDVLGFNSDISGLDIHDNTFSGTPGGGYVGIFINHTLEGTDTIYVQDNNFSGNVVQGIVTERSNTEITDNILNTSQETSSYGIIVQDWNARVQDSVTLDSNTVEEFAYGMLIGRTSPSVQVLTNIAVTNNTVTNNDIGIKVRASADGVAINENTISGNDTYNLENTDSNTLDATNNYWGTASPSAIEASLNENPGLINYAPYYVNEEMITSSNEIPSIVYVDATYTEEDADSHYFGYDAFATIQEGIDAVAESGTINVAAGTYVESPNISKGLILQGVSGTNLQGQITIAHDNVTVDRFDITNPTAGYGIVATDYSNLSITNNTIHDIGTTLTSGSAQAVYIKSNVATVTDIHITGNHISNIGNTNLIYGSSGSAKGIFIGDSTGVMDFDGVTISNNNISNVAASGDAWPNGRGAYGILVNHGNKPNYGSTKNLTISGNTISNLNGLWAHAIGLEGNTPSAGVTGNIISNLTDHKAEHDSIGVFFEDNEDAGSVSVHNNSFDRTTIYYGVAVNPTTAPGVIDTAQNWWGTPAEDEIQAMTTSNIDYDPWYLDSEMTILSSDVGQATIYVDDSYVNVAACEAAGYYWHFNCFNVIQEGIDITEEGGTVNVAAGTYNERIVINKPLTLRGATYNTNKNGYAVPTNYAWDSNVESIINNPEPALSTSQVVDIISDDVVFEGFVVQSLNALPSSANDHLLRLNATTGTANDGDVTDETLDNILIKNNIIGPNTNLASQNGTNGRMGLYFASPNYPADERGITNTLVTGNKIIDSLGNGNNVFVWGAAENYGSPSNADYTGTIIGDNEISGSHRSGIEIAGGVDGLAIQNNSIHDNSGFTGDDPNNLKYGNGIVVIRMGSDKTSATAMGSENLVIKDNQIYNNEKNAIYFGPINSGHSLSGNTINDNGWDAIRIDLDETYHSGNTPVYDRISGITLNSNGIYGNGGGVQVLGTPSNDFEAVAELNWWNTTTGPYHSTNLGGLGDETSDNVDFRPWCVAADCATQDSTAPSVVSGSQTPPDDAVGVSLLPTVSLEFDEEIQCGAGDWADCFSIDSANGIFDYSDNELVFTPDDNLDYNNKYGVNLTDIIDLAGNFLGDVSWNFITLTNYLISLEAGWNLISIPTAPSQGNDISLVLGDAEESIESVWRYDAQTDDWDVYHVNGEPNTSDLDTMEPGYGYWIKATGVATIQGEGSLFGQQEDGDTAPQGSLPSIDLINGWNLIGYYQRAGDESAPISYALTSLANKWNNLITYINSYPVSLEQNDIVDPGEAFWAFLTSDTPYGPGDKYNE